MRVLGLQNDVVGLAYSIDFKSKCALTGSLALSSAGRGAAHGKNAPQEWPAQEKASEKMEENWGEGPEGKGGGVGATDAEQSPHLS